MMALTWSNTVWMIVYMVVLDQCQDQLRCRLLASTGVYGLDPCPATSKYLQVAYKCRPNEFRSREVCQGSPLELKCVRSQRLAIYSAKYGWSQNSESADKCSAYSPYARPCESDCAYSHVHSRCHGRKRCSILVLDSTFQNNCAAGTPTFLSVVFTCVPRRILKDIDDGQDYPDPCDAESSSPPPEHSQTTSTAQIQGNLQQPDIDPEDSEDLFTDTAAVLPSKPQGNADHVDIDVIVDDESTPVAKRPEPGAVQNAVAGFISDWIFAWNFIKDNLEKFILYVVLGVVVGIIGVLLVIICRINQLRRRSKQQAKLNLSEPIANSTVAPHAETTSLLDASDPSDGGVEMTSYNQIGSLHRPPVSSFTDPYEDETPATFPARDRHDEYADNHDIGPPAQPGLYVASVPRNTHNGGGGAPVFTGSLSRPNHIRQTSFTGSLGRNSQPGMLTGSLNRRDHWTNEYRNDSHAHTIQHYYG